MAGKGGLAEQIRVGLETEPAVKPAGKDKVRDPLDELSYGKPVSQHVREFGVLMGAVFVAIAAIQIYKHGSTTGPFVWSLLAGLFVSLGLLAPRALHPAWKGWMAFAHVLGFVSTTIILSVAWTIMLVPLGFLLRVLSIRVMDMTFRAPVQTYWESRDPKLDDFQLLRRQF
jgi:hypothetical protein